jgi:hypothetical protein
MSAQTKLLALLWAATIIVSAVLFYNLCEEPETYEPDVFVYPYDGKEYIIIDGKGGAYMMMHTPSDSVKN